MPLACPTPCRHAGCHELTTSGGYCPIHAAAHTPAARAAPRPSAHSRGYDARWQRASRDFRATHPSCARCDRLADVVDHIVPHRGDPALFWNAANWQSLCKACHDSKTAREDGGWGRPPAPRLQ